MVLVRSLLLSLNTADWVIYKEKKFIVFAVLKEGKFKVKRPHLVSPFLLGGLSRGLRWRRCHLARGPSVLAQASPLFTKPQSHWIRWHSL